jgi:SHS2 domain-containing protein
LPPTEASFEIVEHTGDVAVRLCARDLAGLVVAGVFALRALLFEGSPAGDAARKEARAEVRGVDAEDTLVQALSEALHAVQDGDLYPLSVEAEERDGSIALHLTGVAPDGERLRRTDEIKAVTYHGVAIRRADGELETLVVFDV